MTVPAVAAMDATTTGPAHDADAIDPSRSPTPTARERDLAATRQFFTRALGHGTHPAEVSTDRAPTYPRVLDELLPATFHITEQYATTRSKQITAV